MGIGTDVVRVKHDCVSYSIHHCCNIQPIVCFSCIIHILLLTPHCISNALLRSSNKIYQCLYNNEPQAHYPFTQSMGTQVLLNSLFISCRMLSI